MEYQVIYGNTIGELVSKVNEKIDKEGFKPLGGVSPIAEGRPGYMQAMVKRDAT